MKNKITKLFLALLAITLSNDINAQEQVGLMPGYMRKATNINFLQKFAQEKTAEYEQAVQIAKDRGAVISGTAKDGSSFHLKGFDSESNQLIYYKTYYNNTESGSSLQTANAKPLHILGIDGQNVKVAVWDGGVAPSNHYSLLNRISVKDNGNMGMDPEGILHATHVTGTVAANNFIAEAKGFAPNANVWSYNYANDESEMASAAGLGLLVSNHSYGLDYDTWSQGPGIFGRYGFLTVPFDEIANAQPYYTMVFAAGNDRQKGFNPGKGGRDLISTAGVAKNVITVASTKGTENFSGITGVSSPNNFLAAYSNWGPTDDFRIKPDISAKGDNVFSLSNSTIGATTTMSGTSMASPAVTGVIVLWQDYFSQLFSVYMKSATVKAIMIHTAREAGEAEGPDYKFGWGLINADGGAQVMRDKAQNLAVIAELTINQGQSLNYEFEYDGLQPLTATIAWNDPAGSALNTTNVNLPSLVNDLDLRIINVDTGVQYFPWALNHSWTSEGSNIASRMDNTRDNVERVNVNSAPSGTYKIVVSHKGVLKNQDQDFSLVVSGSGTEMPSIGDLSVKEDMFTNLKLYPNPVADILNIAGDNQELAGSNIDIYDLAGRKVLYRQNAFSQGEDSEVFDVSILKSGIYILDISNGGRRQVLKFIKK